MTTKSDNKRAKTDKSKLARPKDAVKDLQPKAPADAEKVRGGYKPQKDDGS